MLKDKYEIYTKLRNIPVLRDRTIQVEVWPIPWCGNVLLLFLSIQASLSGTPVNQLCYVMYIEIKGRPTCLINSLIVKCMHTISLFKMKITKKHAQF